MEHSLLASHLLSYCALKRLASRGGRNRSSTRLSAWGVNYEKGACTSPLFHFRPQFSPQEPRSLSHSPFTYTLDIVVTFCGRLRMGMNQKSERPLGGAAARAWDGGYSNPKSVGFFRPQGCAREQPNGTGALMLQETQRTPDYWRSLLYGRAGVHSSGDSFCPVLLARRFAAKLVRRYF